MEISILVTVKNDLNNLKLLLSSLKKLSEDIEIVVVDGYSTDGTYEFLEMEMKEMKLVLGRKEGNRSVGRNECIRLSSGSKLVFLDSDTEIAPNWEDSLKKVLDRDIVAGKIIQKSDSKWSDLDRVPIIYKDRDVTYPSNNLMYSRKVLDKIGNFDERFNTAEDIDLNIRAIDGGYDIFYDENIVVFHHPRQSFNALLLQSYYDGIGRRLIKKKHGLKSSLNFNNLKKHPLIETTRLASGIIGYIFGGEDH